MNVKLASYCASVLIAASLCAYADEPGPKKGSAEFERMKSLVGTWKGKTDMGQGPVEITLRLSRDLQFTAGYAYTAATVLSYPGNPGGVDLVGLDVPQVPRNVFTWQARYWNPSRLLLSVTGLFVGQQFDDDQNQLPLE